MENQNEQEQELLKNMNEEDFVDFNKIIYSKYLNGVSIENITLWVNLFSPSAQSYKKGASEEDINEIVDMMNEIFL